MSGVNRFEFEKSYLTRKDKKIRTKHFNEKKEALFTNSLFRETSPYLLQHAHNPVQWFPWKEEAFTLAKKQNRPVLLSIGYSTCHWCHVMEEESFEDLEIANYINEHYVPIKVDREERPEIDAIFMSAVQILTGRGGWPMTLWLTYEKKPFFAGTYFPPRDGERGMATGFLTLLKRLKEAYHEDFEKILLSSESIIQAVQKTLSPSPTPLSPEKEASQGNREFQREGRSFIAGEDSKNFNFRPLMDQCVKTCRELFDSQSGGLKGAPKFPSAFPLRFLLRQFKESKDSSLLHMVRLTLESMAKGGIYDQIGGGFHRYSTDSFWRIPHFEKMLPDNSYLIITYLEAYQVTGRVFFKEVAKDILEYISREMSSDEGAFYSGSDADSLTSQGDKEEGSFFVWDFEELKSLLSPEELSFVKAYYNIHKHGPHNGKNVLYVSRSIEEISQSFGLKISKASQLLKSSRDKMYRFRLEKSPPLRDEKILLSWNASMISAFAFGGFVLNEKKYLERAEKTAEFILKNMVQNHRLLRNFSPHQNGLKACLDDYTFFVSALLSLYERTGKSKWFQEAQKWDRVLEEYFEDKNKGGYFKTSEDHEKLPVREKSLLDGAEPSGNSIQAMNLLKLSVFTSGSPEEKAYLRRLEKMFGVFLENFKHSPFSFSEMLLALDFYMHGGKQVIIVTPAESPGSEEVFLKELRSFFLPHTVLTVFSEEESKKENVKPLLEKREHFKEKRAHQDRPTAYLCEKSSCQEFTHDPQELLKQLS